jgi:V8-like Glu-specific endopeptidase/ankyrin repeat protein
MKRKSLVFLAHKTCQFGLKSLILSGLLNTSPHAMALNLDRKVVYGEDNRKEFHEVSETYQKLASATAAQIDKNYLIKTEENNEVVFLLQADRLTDSILNVCEEQTFAKQTSAGNCSGFLVGPNLLVTAGHCIQSMNDCERFHWVFDYKIDKGESDVNNRVKASNVYTCKKVINQKFTYFGTKDHALIQLDRAVTDREPLKVRTSGKISDAESVVVMGYPSGLPLKIADGAAVRKNDGVDFFSANLDTFGGNSGSSVFNATTGEVEGILVRGDTDYVMDEKRGCHVINTCKNDECRGEDVTRIAQIVELTHRDEFFAAIDANDEAKLNEIIKLGFNVEMPHSDLKSPLVKAIEAKNREVTSALLQAGASAIVYNESGISALSVALERLDQEALVQILSLSKYRVVKIEGKDILSFALDVNSGDRGTHVLAALLKTDLIKQKELIKISSKLVAAPKEVNLLAELGVDFSRDYLGQSLLENALTLLINKPKDLRELAQNLRADLSIVKKVTNGNGQIEVSLLAEKIMAGADDIASTLVQAGARFASIRVVDEPLSHLTLKNKAWATFHAMLEAGLMGDESNTLNGSNLPMYMLELGITNADFERVLKVTQDLRHLNYAGYSLITLAKSKNNKRVVKQVRQEKFRRGLSQINPFDKE